MKHLPIGVSEVIKILISESDRSLQLECAVLVLLYCTETVTVDEISESIGLQKRYRNMILQRLEEKVLITRRVTNEGTLVFLTKNGIDYVREKRDY